MINQNRPCIAQARVKIKEAHFINWHPSQIIGFRICFVSTGIGTGMCDDSVISPVAVVVRKDCFEFKMLWLYARFFVCLASSCRD